LGLLYVIENHIQNIIVNTKITTIIHNHYAIEDIRVNWKNYKLALIGKYNG